MTRRPRPQAAAASGAAFTLIEVLLAVAILGVCVTTLLAARNRSLAAQVEAADRLDSLAVAEAALGQWLAEEHPAPLGEVPGRTGWAWSAAEEAVLGETGDGRRLVIHRVVVHRPGPDGRPRAFSLATARCEKDE
jgi:prepilin-type N-terminal cleavage/methylation domain-containing protein